MIAVVAVGLLFPTVMNETSSLAHDCLKCKFRFNHFHGQRCLDGSVFLIGIRDRIRSLFFKIQSAEIDGVLGFFEIFFTRCRNKIQSAEIDGVLGFFEIFFTRCRNAADDHVFRLGRKFVADDIGGFSFRKSRIRCVQSQRSDVRGRSVE